MFHQGALATVPARLCASRAVQLAKEVHCVSLQSLPHVSSQNSCHERPMHVLAPPPRQRNPSCAVSAWVQLPVMSERGVMGGPDGVLPDREHSPCFRSSFF
eukprot:1979438-Rhodomonas_salina.1